ncbi:DUF6880 family protein [Burkholderia sp. Nafp2/4-1b]|uniref:DUF6880 family protein n=1 Tax=Burkholderia sp. Nafp2/4-1b TaxID=2116686 RepID=UPI0013CEBDB1|nr:DUF6880 family protein [Burkholderia sp. Nafp2/4-1b]
MLDDMHDIDAHALRSLGLERLAALLAESAATHPHIRRQLQFECASKKRGDIVTAARRWMRAFREQPSCLDARQVRALSEELDAMRIAISSQVAVDAPDVAADLMWQFIALAVSVFECTTEEGWEISKVFDRACDDVVKLSAHARVAPAVFAAQAVTAIVSDQYGQCQTLIRAIAKTHSSAAVYAAELQELIRRLLDRPPEAGDEPNSKRWRYLKCALLELESMRVA